MRAFSPIETAQFWSKVRCLGPDECWEWTGGFHSNGYGAVTFDYRQYLTHRVAYRLVHGDIAEGLYVCHRCNNPRCCNPHHLYAGTAAENSRQMVEDGRAYRGEHQWAAKLTADDVRAIRASSERHRVLAKRYGVAHTTIGAIRRRKRWRHVP